MVTTRLTMIDAHEYICTVKDTFQDNREMYDTFLMVMKDFRTTRQRYKKSADEVYHEVCDGLFRDQPELRVEFAYFLPRREMGWKCNLNKLG
ncbi:unnamed protein product [Thlaspi arvense]|uniref:Uncharacterized protein n=1 Tax=Thlaspi arvense TaxID=13288 RepID=A0AAU9RUP2_THLAR|nr:unnamed protein product [Thlaspi arvense]